MFAKNTDWNYYALDELDLCWAISSEIEPLSQSLNWQ